MSQFTDKYIDFLAKKRTRLLPLVGIMMVVFVISIFYIKVDLSTEGFLFKDDPMIMQYAKFQEVFGNDQVVIFAVTGDVFSNQYLEKIDSLEKDIMASMPYADDTTSIINISQLYVDTDADGLSSLYVDDLLQDFPERKLNADELANLRETVLNDPVFKNQIISEDGNTSVIVVQLQSEEKYQRTLTLEKESAMQESNRETGQGSSSGTEDFDDFNALFDDTVSLDDTVSETDNAATKEYQSTYLSNQANNAIYAVAKELKQRYAADDFEIALVGFTLIIPVTMNAMFKDSFVFIPLLLLMVIVFVKITMRRISAVFFAMITIGITNLSIFSLMSFTDTKISLVSNIIPAVMITISMGAVIHLLVMFFSKYDEDFFKSKTSAESDVSNKTMHDTSNVQVEKTNFGYDKAKRTQSKIDALKYAFGHSSWPIFITGLTSAAGIFSFFFSQVKPVQDFGLFCGFGMMFSLVAILFVVPLLILALPIKPIIPHENKLSNMLDIMLEKLSHVAYKARYVTMIVSTLIIIVAFLGVKNVYFSHKPLDWLPKSSEFRADTAVLDKVMKGSNFLEIYVDTKEDGGVYDPVFLNKMDYLEKFMYEYGAEGSKGATGGSELSTQGASSQHSSSKGVKAPTKGVKAPSKEVKVGNVLSLNTILKKTNRILHEDDPAYYRIPESRELVAQELILLENGGANTLEKFVDLNYRYFRASIILPDLDAVYFSLFLNDLKREMDKVFEDSNYDVTANTNAGDNSGVGYEYYTTGGVNLLTKVIDATINSSKTSYLIAFIVITFLMILFTKRISIGLVSMLPNLLPIFVLLGIIGYSSSINLDMFVLLVGCVLLGIAVDNTIHFIHVYTQYYKEGLSIESSITRTFLTTGKAMTSTSIILLAGFGVFMFAGMRNYHNFGLLAVVGVLVALFSDFLMTPALLVFLTKWKLLKR